MHPGCADRNTSLKWLFALVTLVTIRHKTLEPVSDGFKWMKTLEMKSLPICCECLTVTDMFIHMKTLSHHKTVLNGFGVSGFEPERI